MKNVFKIIGIIALTAVIGFAFASCGEGGGGAQSVVYKGVDAGGLYTLTITESSGKAVYSSQIGDNYKLEYTDGNRASNGTVTAADTGLITLQPNNASVTFIANVSGNNLTGMTGSVTWEDDESTTLPGDGSLEPPANDALGLAISGFPARYALENKYVFGFEFSEDGIYAASSISEKDNTITGTRIVGSNVSNVKLNVWKEGPKGGFYDYHGSRKVNLIVLIANKAVITFEEIDELLESDTAAWLVGAGEVEAVFKSGTGTGTFVAY
ncbi:MAG: hypothetical protein FWC06_06545 [Treponema sp.]|nr:hypothetical protein [Treponema sp.]